MKEIGVYIHIPFCKSKCYYCDFVSYENKENLIKRYVQALKKEIIYKFNKDYIVKTIYFGGGTPSYLSENYIEELLILLSENNTIYKEAEITIEINPGTVNIEKLKKYCEIGINRLSIGLQSSNNKILKSIGRIHTYEQYEQTVNMAKRIGFNNINSDIIIGLPNQTMEDVQDSINKMIQLELTHISVYSLIMEENTVLTKKIENCELTLPDEELERSMYWTAKKMLEEAGYIHYEVSNFAKLGYESKHNLDCWNQKEYLGFGLGASSYENKIRYSNIANIEKYIDNIKTSNFYKNIIIEEKQDNKTQENEFMLLGLRTIQGVNIKEFEKKFNKNPIEVFKDKLLKLELDNLIEINLDNIKLSDKGIDLANLVWMEFVN
ncbi:MAG: oxygen-independent coproporphyrinogen III oxidase [Clostridia bacterium]|nr:oxygen-independent coproporphyrinogen III oxidase [Clostridia bacterium]